MNGRIYDPLLGRFLSADVVVQAPGNLQAYNRYSYVLNNPLTFTDPTGFFWDPDSGWWGASEWGIFGKAAVVDPAVEGYKSGSLSMEKGMTEIANANGALDVTIGVLQIVSGVGEGVGIVADYAPGGKQVKATANVLAKNADEIGEAASKLTKALSSKADDAAGAARVENRFDNAAVDAKKVDVDPSTSTAAEASGGRKGKPETRAQNQQIGEANEAAGRGDHTGGGDLPETYFPNPDGGAKGGRFGDVTNTSPEGKRHVTQTVDTKANGEPTEREIDAALDIYDRLDEGETLDLIPKRR